MPIPTVQQFSIGEVANTYINFQTFEPQIWKKGLLVEYSIMNNWKKQSQTNIMSKIKYKLNVKKLDVHKKGKQ